MGLDIGYSWDQFTEGWKGKYVSPRAKAILARAEEDIAAGMEPDVIRPAVDFYDTPDETYTDGSNARLAIDFIYNHSGDQPYFLAVGFAKPHLPFVAPKKYWDLYDRDSIELPEYDTPPEGITEFTLSPYKEIESYLNKSVINEEKILELRHGYYACVSYVDAQIGKIIKALEDKGELDNTIILLWGDHGFKLGDFGEWAKATNLEADARVPLILRLPSKNGAGLQIDAPVELVDVLPTLCDAAGIATPESVEGKSLLSFLCSPAGRFRDFALTQFRRSGTSMGYSIRTSEWRYTEWIDPKTGETRDEELYRINDEKLMEDRNLENEYPAEVSRLSKMLHDYLDTAIKWEGEIIP
jgi:iduronate 2-sulfatase